MSVKEEKYNDVDVHSVQKALKTVREWSAGLEGAVVLSNIVLNQKRITKKLEMDAKNYTTEIEKGKAELSRLKTRIASEQEHADKQKIEIGETIVQCEQDAKDEIISVREACEKKVKAIKDESDVEINACRDAVELNRKLKEEYENSVAIVQANHRQAEEAYSKFKEGIV